MDKDSKVETTLKDLNLTLSDLHNAVMELKQSMEEPDGFDPMATPGGCRGCRGCGGGCRGCGCRGCGCRGCGCRGCGCRGCGCRGCRGCRGCGCRGCGSCG